MQLTTSQIFLLIAYCFVFAFVLAFVIQLADTTNDKKPGNIFVFAGACLLLEFIFFAGLSGFLFVCNLFKI